VTEIRSIEDLIEDLIDYRGKTPPKAQSGVPLITAKVIKGGRILAEPREYIADDIYDSWMRRGLPRTGDILITTEAPLGEVAQVGADARIALAQRVILLRPDHSKVDPQFLFHYLRSPQAQASLRRRSSGTTVSGIRQPELKAVEVALIPRQAQVAVGRILDSIEGHIKKNDQREQVLENIGREIYREWFIHFRFPGRGDTRLIQSPLGPIPEGWGVRTVASIASEQRHAVSSGPFGSKLGRQDYRAQGVPVIRGANLRVGGGFSESVLVFVSEKKAEELRSSWARRGDIVITQRGTLGQVGLIHSRSRFDRYVLSQSQMKVTTDARIAAPMFFYAQMCSAPTAQRFVAQAMTSGVPHVNLRLLRDFPVLVPPTALQDRYAKMAEPLQHLASLLADQTSRLVAIRDLLLPKLVTGQIDVSTLNLDALAVGAVA
jgi:type I restriction enzyme S subunit